MNVIITGATGMIGGIIQQLCIASPLVNSITSITRRASGVTNEKLNELMLKDFDKMDTIESSFSNQDIAFFCLGAYTGAVPDEIFKKITVDYSNIFADLLNQNSPNARSCFLSGAGADPKEKSRTAFARYKGMAENHLLSKSFPSISIFRPGYIYPVTKRDEPNLMYTISRSLYPILKLLGSKYSITSTDLAQAMFQTGVGSKQEKKILENNEILDILS